MKKPNKHITRLVVWTVSGSLLTSSCVNMVPEPLSVNKVEQLADMGLPAINVSLTTEQADYFSYISDLTHKIISDREFAKEFNKVPSKYLKSRSIDIDIEITDDALMRITTALADDDIVEAIANNDIKQYLRLMHKKGLLDNTANDYANLLTVDEKKQLLQSLGVTNINEQQLQTMAVAAVVFIFYIAVIAVSYAGAAYTAVAAVNLGVGLSVVYAAAAATKTKVSGATHLQISKNFDVYMLSTCENKEITFDNVDLTKVVDDAVEVYKELYVADAKTIDTNRLKQTINLNLSKQPAVSENVLIIERDGKSL